MPCRSYKNNLPAPPSSSGKRVLGPDIRRDAGETVWAWRRRRYKVHKAVARAALEATLVARRMAEALNPRLKAKDRDWEASERDMWRFQWSLKWDWLKFEHDIWREAQREAVRDRREQERQEEWERQQREEEQEWLRANPTSPWAILGVPLGCGKDLIKQAHRALVKLWHPDVCADPAAMERFREVQTAYEVLTCG